MPPEHIDRAIISVQVAREGGKREAVDLSSDLRSLTYEDDEKKADKLTLVVDNFDLRFWDDDTFKMGNTLTVGWGYQGNVQTTECVIDRVSGGPFDIQIEASHTGFLLNKNKKSAVYNNVTRSEVATKIATAHGYGSDLQDIQDTKQKFVHLPQAGMTDGEFLKRLANKQGFVFYVDQTGFHFHERRTGDAPQASFTWYTDNVGQVIDWNYDAHHKKRKGAVKTEGRDPMTKTPFTVESKNSTVPRQSLAHVVDVVDKASGQDSSQTKLADDELRPSVEATPAAAKASSDGAYLKQQQSSHKLSLTVIGDPKLRAKTVIEMKGIGRRLSGLWYVQKCRHEVDDGSKYTTKLECIRDTHHGHKGVTTDAKTGGSVNDQKKTDEPKPVEKVDTVSGRTEVRWGQK